LLSTDKLLFLQMLKKTEKTVTVIEKAGHKRPSWVWSRE